MDDLGSKEKKELVRIANEQYGVPLGQAKSLNRTRLIEHILSCERNEETHRIIARQASKAKE